MKAYLNLTSISLPDWHPVSAFNSFQVPVIIFGLRIEILIITNLSVLGWPPGTVAGGLQVKSIWPLVSLKKVNDYYS